MMALGETGSIGAAPGASSSDRATLAAFAAMLAVIGFLAAAWAAGIWLRDGTGQLISTDFVNHYAAGSLALEGQPALAYDRAAYEAVERRLLGAGFDHYIAWPYPPHALLVVAPLATLPYIPAFFAWLLATGALYVCAVRSILRSPAAIFAALAFPTSAWTVIVGQNGFLTAGLLGLGLSLLTRHPVAAGLFFGLLTYKPQFGILIPLALLAGGYRTAFLSAGATAIAFVGASWLAFGPEAWLAFWKASALAGDAAVIQTPSNIGKFQTPFGIARALGADVATAWSVQAVVTLAAAAAIVVTWRRDVSYEAKAAFLVALTPLATPYAFTYDLTVMFIAIAFLARGGLDRTDRLSIAAVTALLVVAPAGPLLLGFPAVLLLAAVATRRVWRMRTLPRTA